VVIEFFAIASFGTMGGCFAFIGQVERGS
jgi:hypothetical protein